MRTHLSVEITMDENKNITIDTIKYIIGTLIEIGILFMCEENKK